MEKLLEVSDLHVAFSSERETAHAMDGVSFQILQGKTFGLVGESGCGRSRTLRSVPGLLKQSGWVTGGEIHYRGTDIAKMSQRELQKTRGKEVSMIFQGFMTAPNPVLRIHSQMYRAFGGEKLSKEEKRQRAIELLGLVGIPSPEIHLDEYPHQFSDDMRQRVIIVITLGARSKLLLADKLTTALDVTIQGQIMKLLGQLKQELGMSIILVTHDLDIATQMCDRVTVMYVDQIVEMTDTVMLFNRPRYPYTYGLMGSLSNEEITGTTLEAIKSSPPSLTHLPEGCPFSPRCKYTCDLCRRKRPTLTKAEPDYLVHFHRLDVTASFQGLIEIPDGIGRKEDTPHG